MHTRQKTNGVLKDYLRELPEPLFTNALYQMLLDAVSVRLPGDPEGNAQLILSVLECLPKANQETLGYIMDHLKRVLQHSDTNKMTSHNLAVCFGPVLLCPSPQNTPFLDLTKDLKKHVEVLQYLLDIWPSNRGSSQSGTCMSSRPDVRGQAKTATLAVSTTSKTPPTQNMSSYSCNSKSVGGYCAPGSGGGLGEWGYLNPGGGHSLHPNTAYSDHHRQCGATQFTQRPRYRSHSTDSENRTRLQDSSAYTSVRIPSLQQSVSVPANADTFVPKRDSQQTKVPLYRNISVETERPSLPASTYQTNHYPLTSKQYSAYRKMLRQRQLASGYESS